MRCFVFVFCLVALGLCTESAKKDEFPFEKKAQGVHKNLIAIPPVSTSMPTTSLHKKIIRKS